MASMVRHVPTLLVTRMLQVKTGGSSILKSMVVAMCLRSISINLETSTQVRTGKASPMRHKAWVASPLQAYSVTVAPSRALLLHQPLMQT